MPVRLPVYDVFLAEKQACKGITLPQDRPEQQADSRQREDEGNSCAELQERIAGFLEPGSERMQVGQEEEMQEIDVQAPAAGEREPSPRLPFTNLPG